MQTLVHALCSVTTGPALPGCSISVRLSEDGKCIEEYYDVTGAPRFRHGRALFFSLRRYDAVIFVYDATDVSTRSSVSCTWVPEVMRSLGDVGAIESGGRLDGTEIHVRSMGVINELRFLWRQTLFSHAALSVHEAIIDASRLFARLVKLWLNETGLWPDSSVDRQAEAAFLSTSVVPVAIVAMKSDLADKDDPLDIEPDSLSRGVAHIHLHKHSVGHDPRLRAFLKRAAESAKRKAVSNKQMSHAPTSGQVMLGFI